MATETVRRAEAGGSDWCARGRGGRARRLAQRRRSARDISMMGRGQVCDIVLEMFGCRVLLHAGRASRASPPRLARVLGFL